MSRLSVPDAWITVNKSALRHNFAAVRELVGPDVQTIAVVKANAFGHGAGETARTFQEAGADFFAVTTPDEAFELRDAGVTRRILVFLPPLPEQIAALLKAGCDVTVCGGAGVSAVMQAAQSLGKVAAVHLKVDTGMGRLGVLPTDVLTLARQIAAVPSLKLAGVYTHFARVLEKNDAATHQQFALFQQVLAELTSAGIDPGLRHCANSAALVRFPGMRLDAVRPGTILYGQYPSAAVPRTLALQETWKMQARVIAVRSVPAGSAIGYGGEFVTRRRSTLAVLPVGYADGFSVAPASASKGWRVLKSLLRPAPLTVTIRGQRVPIVGRVAMQVCSVDVTDLPGVAAGDLVSVPMRRITASARLPRYYQEQFDLEQFD